MKYVILSVSSVILIVLLITTSIYHGEGSEVTKQQPEQQQLVPEQKPQREKLQPIEFNETITYTLQNDMLNITYNKGEEWIKVPIEKEQLFEGEYNGNEHELITNSYVLTEKLAAFLYSDGVGILLIYSIDQGETWNKSVVTLSYPAMRFRKINFVNDNFGYIIISGDRTMSQEASSVFLTHDGGKSWKETNTSGITRLIADGGFVDESTGFLSYGTINPDKPDFYVTQDGGNTWSEALINIPKKYDKIFVIAETPVKEEDHLSILINQGPSGDYQGGKVKGKFISKDNGKTWEFLKEVQPNESE